MGGVMMLSNCQRNTTKRIWGILRLRRHFKLFVTFLWQFLPSFCGVPGCIVLLWNPPSSGCAGAVGGMFGLRVCLGQMFLSSVPGWRVSQPGEMIYVIHFAQNGLNVMADGCKYTCEHFTLSSPSVHCTCGSSHSPFNIHRITGRWRCVYPASHW